MNYQTIIPILPCTDISAHASFFRNLGFEVQGLYTSPNPYLTLRIGAVDLHFYGTRKLVPSENSSMCFLQVADIDAVYDSFVQAFRQHLGKVPRSGIPRISRLRDLKDDRRFTLTDPGGNTFYIGELREPTEDAFFRTLQHEDWARKFAALYDVMYSKEDPDMAAAMLPKYADALPVLDDLDRAKLLLLRLEITQQLKQPANDAELKQLIADSPDGDAGWEKIKDRYRSILRED